MTITEITLAYETPGDGMVHWSERALFEAKLLLDRALMLLEQDAPDARPELQPMYDAYRKKLRLMRVHVGAILYMESGMPDTAGPPPT